jgi:Predicted glycosyltransferases
MAGMVGLDGGRRVRAGRGDARVHVVIPVRDRCGFTVACLRSLEAQSYGNLAVVVIDDGSTDDTVEVLEREFPQVTVLRGDGNLWWTGATVLGVEYVLERCSDEDFVLTLNNDTTVGPDYVETLLRVAQDQGGSVLVGSVAVDSRDGDTIVDGGPYFNWLTAKGGSHNNGRSLREVIGEGVRTTRPTLLPGRGTLIPIACIREVGNFDALRLPHYAADYEFSARAARAGYRLIMSYEAPVFSQVEATGVRTTHGRLPWRTFLGMFLSRRSPACLLYRWRFALMVAPRGTTGCCSC